MSNSFLESPIENAPISLEVEIPVEQIFDPAVWNEPLGKFAKATGLTISLYDKDSKRRCGVMTSGPIGERLIKAGFWETDGIGSRIDQHAAVECVFFKRPVYSVQLEMFSHLAIPLTTGDELTAVMVLGWIPDRFADPVNCDAVSKKIGVESLELWQLLRMQQPISREKLETHAGMLETFAGPLLQQLAVRMEDRRRTRRAKIVSETALALPRRPPKDSFAQRPLPRSND